MNNNVITDIIVETYAEFLNILWKIWNKRCEKVIEWELLQEIKTTDKKKNNNNNTNNINKTKNIRNSNNKQINKKQDSKKDCLIHKLEEVKKFSDGSMAISSWSWHESNDYASAFFLPRVDGFEEITGKLSLYTGRMQE
ncbi:hypothetical protein Glove_91g7 [Diversispora epigaea]|uniref:Uncharacterized protein n=1 Tax=Diversispora epigaea TaxID=1348612 RepID=A0A397J9T2_9GLOM|nr:hypothetical protein Glove_91g7 [Diversispora epigaea]